MPVNPTQRAKAAEAGEIMLAFAHDTGLLPGGDVRRRYLWTDAHAVCNFLSLYRGSGDEQFCLLAEKLIDAVHHVLGRHRDDDERVGWVSGLDEEEGELHPTAGGLRIGKPLQERAADEPLDERVEWDRDGQYFHYLTKWMHALSRASHVTGDARYSRFAAELLKAAYAAFTFASVGTVKPRLRWKMSIDLSRPLVPSAGLHDPLDGYITCNEVALAARITGAGLADLAREVRRGAEMIEGLRWNTEDPLGIGGLLVDTLRCAQLSAAGSLPDSTLTGEVIRASRQSLDAWSASMNLTYPAEYRLAFRELGLSIGLHAIERLRGMLRSDNEPAVLGKSLRQEVDAMWRFAPLAEVIEDFWRTPENQQARSWRDHADINRVMLATSLLPDEMLAVGKLGRQGALL